MNHIINNVMNFTAKAVEVKKALNTEDMTTGEILVEGLLYTVIGMGITFVVLIAIALIIWMFKFIRVFETSMANKKNVTTTTNIQAEIQPVVEDIFAVEELVDDLELVAVISAAIAASLNTSTDSLQVRSIRKVRA